MDLGFRGEVAELYQTYRRGYPDSVIAALVDTLSLNGSDLVVDLGCGTGQVAIPLARHVRAVVGVDPEPDMLARARRASEEAGVANVCWMVGADTDLPTLHAVVGDEGVGAFTIGQALHWMDHEMLFSATVPLLRPGGGVAVLTNGVPLWLQSSRWSQALRGFLQEWFQTTTQKTCGTDATSQQEYAESMRRAGLVVSESVVEYAEELTLDHVIGSVYSALSPEQLPDTPARPEFARRLGDALAPHAPFIEQVPVTTLLGRPPG